MTFDDDSTLEDILGCIYVAEAWPAMSHAIPIEEQLKEIEDRIRSKMLGNRNKIRNEWFTRALECLNRARKSFTGNDLESARESLRKVEDYLVSGNKAHRRKARFAVKPDGKTSEL